MKIFKRTTLIISLLFLSNALFAASTDATLEAIEVNSKGVNIVTGFTPATLTYTFTPSPSPTEVTLRAVPTDKKAKVVIKIGAATYTNHSLVGLVGGNVDITFSVTAEDGTTKKDYVVSLTTGGGGGGGGTGTTLETTYYSTNPSGGVGKFSSTMNVIKNANMTSDGFTDWTADMLIAQSAANDICQSFRGSHEYPIFDTYTLYAAWDNDNLYLGWQYVNVIDITDPSQNGQQTDNGKPWNGEHRVALALDIDKSKSATGLLSDGITGVWDAPGNYFNTFENGLDVLCMFSPKPGSGVPAIFKLNASGTFDMGASYITTFAAGGVVYGYVDGLHPSITKVYGINKPGAWAGYAPAELEGTAGFVDLLAAGHKKTQDTFYEMKIPFTALGIDKAYLETNGIGAMLISSYGNSGTTSIPYDATTYDHVLDPYTSDSSSSAEKNDKDNFTYQMARIGKK